MRRKTLLFSSGAFTMKHGGRKNNNLSIFVVVFSVFLFGCFMYNEDVKSIAEFPFSRPKSDQEIHEDQSSSKDQINTNNNRKESKDNEDHEEIPIVKSSRTIVEKDVESSTEEDDDNAQLSIVKEQEEQQKLEMAVEEEEDNGDGDDNDDDDEEIQLPPEDCDLFTGQWVLDNISHPIYKEPECEFLTAQVTCLRNGRRDSLFQNWRWQPRDCSLPK